jgi:hypothetical protein
MSDGDDTITHDTRTPAVPGNRTLVQHHLEANKATAPK